MVEMKGQPQVKLTYYGIFVLCSRQSTQKVFYPSNQAQELFLSWKRNLTFWFGAAFLFCALTD